MSVKVPVLWYIRQGSSHDKNFFRPKFDSADQISYGKIIIRPTYCNNTVGKLATTTVATMQN